MGSESGFQLTDSGPAAYERYMVPIHCESRTVDLLDRIQPQAGEHLLDVACGTGVVTRHAARRVGARGRVVGVDIQPAMLEIARSVSALTVPVEFLEGPAESLPVPNGAFDAVTCQLGLMFFPDRQAAASEMGRVLKPGGRVAVSVFRTPEYNPAFTHLIGALKKHADPSAAEFMTSPFVIESPDEMRDLFEQAGFSNIRVTNRIMTLRYPSVTDLVRYETLNISDPALHSDETQRALVEEMTSRVSGSIDDDGVAFPSQDFVVVARR